MELSTTAYWLLKNMWSVSFNSGVYPFWQNNYFELRTPGRVLKLPWYYYLFLSGNTDNRKRLLFNYELGYAKGLLKNKPFFRSDFGTRYRFNNRFTLSLEVERQHDKGQIGYAFLRETNGEPIIGFRSFKDFTTTLSGTYHFTPRMNLSLRGRHYWSNVHYLSFHNVTADGYYLGRPFINNQDENFNAFNIDAFFTWDFKPGSRIIAGWKNWLSNNVIDARLYRRYVNNLQQTLDLPHANELTVRVIYFLNCNQFKRSH